MKTSLLLPELINKWIVWNGSTCDCFLSIILNAVEILKRKNVFERDYWYSFSLEETELISVSSGDTAWEIDPNISIRDYAQLNDKKGSGFVIPENGENLCGGNACGDMSGQGMNPINNLWKSMENPTPYIVMKKVNMKPIWSVHANSSDRHRDENREGNKIAQHA